MPSDDSAGRTQHLPCNNCGADMIHGENTKVEVELEYSFQGKPAVREVDAKVCPECAEVRPV